MANSGFNWQPTFSRLVRYVKGCVEKVEISFMVIDSYSNKK